MVRFFRDPQTNEFLVAGAGQPHIEALVSKLKRRYHTNVVLKAPEGALPRDGARHAPRRRAGTRSRPAAMGSSAIASCASSRCRAARALCLPTRSSAGRFRGSTFRRWRRAFASRRRAASWRAIRWSTSRSRCSTAATTMSTPARWRSSWLARIAFRKCMEQAKPALLEPVMKIEIEAPDEFAGALMGDLSGRRGRVQGMESGKRGNGRSAPRCPWPRC